MEMFNYLRAIVPSVEEGHVTPTLKHPTEAEPARLARQVGVTNISQFSPFRFFPPQNHGNDGYLLSVTFISERCLRNWAAVTPVNYERDWKKKEIYLQNKTYHQRRN